MKYPNNLEVALLKDEYNNQVLFNDKDNNALILNIIIHSKKDEDITCCANRYLGKTPDSTSDLDGKTAYKYIFSGSGYCDAGQCSGPFETISFDYDVDAWIVLETKSSFENFPLKDIISTFEFIE